jgi:uncharacterized RDD family membrane protein YckC
MEDEVTPGQAGRVDQNGGVGPNAGPSETHSGEEHEGDRNGNGGRMPSSLAGRLFSTGSRGAQRIADVSGLDEVIQSAAEDAVVRAIESEATEKAISAVINGPLIENAVSQALASEQVENAIIEALDSQMADRIWEHVLDGPHTQRLIERIAEAPEVRAAIAAQGIGLIGDIGHQVGVVTRMLDFIGERISRKVLLRPRRSVATDRAGFFTRALGVGIDALIVNVALISFAALLGLVTSALGLDNGSGSTNWIAAGGVFWFVVSSLYLFTFWSLSGQTPGMRFLDIRIEVDGNPRIGARHARRRLLGFWASAAMLGLGFIGTLIRLDRRGLHDRFGGTNVYFIDPVKPDQQHIEPALSALDVT